MISRFLKSSRFAVAGIFYGLQTERNVQIWFGVLLFNLIFSWILEVNLIEFLFILTATFSIGIAEYLNTSLETLADRVTLEKDEMIKRVKDLAAGATFLASTLTAIICLIIFLPKILLKLEIIL